MGGDIVYRRRRLTSRADKPHVNLQSQSLSQVPEPNSSTKMTNESVVDDQLHIHDSAKSEKLRQYEEVTSGMPSYVPGKRQSLASPDLSICSAEPKSIQNQYKRVTMGGDIVYKRRRLTSRTDKPYVNLQSQSPSQIPEPNSSTKMTKESKVDDQLHSHDSAKSKTLQEHDEVTNGMPSYVPGKRYSLASPVHRDIHLNRPLDGGDDEHNLTIPSNILTEECHYQGTFRNKRKAPAYSSSMGTSSRNACLQLYTDNRSEAMPMQAHKQQTPASLQSSCPHGVYLHPERTMNSHATSWSDVELDCLWIGVRRHGKGNWDAMLADPILRSLAWKTPCDLALRWEEEQLRLRCSRTFSQTPLTNIQTASSTSSYGNARMQLPNTNNGIFMSLLRQVEMESAMKALGTANSSLLTGRANTEQEESRDACSEDTISDAD